jgi:capsular polysaccharide biosynthesis protein
VIDVSWNIQDEDPESELTGPPRALLGTWHYLRNSLRREWRTWVSLAFVGAMLGLAVVMLLPPISKSTVTLLMAHPSNMDGPSAMSNDLSFLNTRAVAAKTVEKLHLPLTPEAFQSTVSAEALTSEILSITVSAPDQKSAVARAQALTEQYLAFRADQLRSQSSGLIDGYKTRITTMQQQVSSLNSEYAKVSGQGAAGENRANDILTQRAELNARITDMQQAIEDASLTADAAISSTHAIDSARPVSRSTKKALVVDVASGLIAGAALGVGFVLFRALTSDRLRRREDVAVALRAPVRFSVASRGPQLRRRRLLRLRRRSGWHGRDLEVLAHGLETAVVPPKPSARHVPASSAAVDRGVALAAVGNAGAAGAIVMALATRLRAMGQTVFLVDLSASGSLSAQVSSAQRRRRWPRWTRKGRATQDAVSQDAAGLKVFRPTAGAGLARGPADLDPRTEVDSTTDAWRDEWEAADVILALAEVNPGIDAENLTSWVSQVVPLVSAGESTPELLRTTAELVRAAGLALPFALMVGSHNTDESLGLVDPFDRARAASVGEP